MRVQNNEIQVGSIYVLYGFVKFGNNVESRVIVDKVAAVTDRFVFTESGYAFIKSNTLNVYEDTENLYKEW